MLSWPDALCDRLAAAGGPVRYDLRDNGESTTADPKAPAFANAAQPAFGDAWLSG